MRGGRTTVGRGLKQQPKQFSRGRHNYEHMVEINPDVCTLSLKQTNDKLSERLQYKLNRQYKEADAIQRELSNNYSVAIHDGCKIWRADGEGFGSAAYDIGGKEARAQKNDGQRRVRTYDLYGEPNGLSPSDIELVEIKISARSEAKRDNQCNIAKVTSRYCNQKKGENKRIPSSLS